MQGLQLVEFSLIGRNIEFVQTQCLSDRETGHNLKSHSASSSTNDYCGQYDASYYQTQPPDYYKQLQQYCHNTTTPRYPYRTDYDK